MSPFLKGCGYNLKKDVIYIPISGLSGANLKEKASSSVCNWYSGPSLLETLDSLKPIPRDPTAPLRLPVVDRYKEV